MSLRKIFNPAGGIIYHLRAFRYGLFFWRPYIKALEPLLLKWTPGTDQIVIIGSSSGYSLTGKFLRRFKSVIINEPDPLARLIFRLRFPFVNVKSDNTDFIIPPDGVSCLAHKYPEAAILFSNILGQRLSICKRSTKTNRCDWLATLPHTLDKHNWFSYHDRISTRTALITSKPLESARELSPDELMDHFCGTDYSTTYIDHETDALKQPDINRTYLPWVLKPSKIHIIEVIKRP